jgi:hypothetical protein
MRVVTALLLGLAAAIAGCGGSLNGTTDGGIDFRSGPACSTLSACACYAASDRCSMRTEPCWCPSECNPNIACGGGQFLGCQDKAAANPCDTELARVQTLCAGQAFVSMIGGLCASNPTCVADCLAQLGTVDSCTQIDCSFCTTCDCVAPLPESPLRICISNCNLPAPPLR